MADTESLDTKLSKASVQSKITNEERSSYFDPPLEIAPIVS